MVDNIFSSSWHRVVDLKLRLRAHVSICRHVYRGQVWHVLQDPLTGAHYRFDPAAHFLIGLLNGDRTMGQVWDAACDRLGDDAPTQDEAIQVLANLHTADVLQSNIAPDTLELFRRGQRHSQTKVFERLASPFSIRVPLIDPDRFLERWANLVRPLFTPVAALGWLGCVLAALLVTWLHWPQLTHDIAERTLAPRNLVLLALTYPLVKALHELGHAFATKIWGGAVHEMGVVFLLLVPVPYVDASASSAFPARYRRMVVGAAGIIVELFLASCALLLWLVVEPGVVRDLAFNVMLIGGVSSLFFNGNPLLRFDGYYVLADAIDIPNLATRSRRFLAYLVQRHLFGMQDTATPVQAHGERGWFLVYAVSSFVYRLLVLFAISIFVASEFPVAGTALAIWGITAQILLPILKAVGFVLASPRLAGRRFRALSTTAVGIGSLVALLFLLPVTSWNVVEGVVWLPERSHLRAGTEGFVSRVRVQPDTWVEAGEPIIDCEDPALEAEARLLEARLDELRVRYRHERTRSIATAQLVDEELRAVESELARVNERRQALTIAAPMDGIFVMHRPQDLVGRFLRQGDLVGYVIDGPSHIVRVVVPQTDADLVKSRTTVTKVRLAYKAENLLLGNLERAVPLATNRLPAKSLGTAGGGRLPVDPLDEEGLKSAERVFQFDVALPAGAPAYYFGQRAYVRFEHGDETLAAQWFRSLRQLFLAKFET